MCSLISLHLGCVYIYLNILGESGSERLNKVLQFTEIKWKCTNSDCDFWLLKSELLAVLFHIALSHLSGWPCLISHPPLNTHKLLFFFCILIFNACLVLVEEE